MSSIYNYMPKYSAIKVKKNTLKLTQNKIKNLKRPL